MYIPVRIQVAVVLLLLLFSVFLALQGIATLVQVSGWTPNGQDILIAIGIIYGLTGLLGVVASLVVIRRSQPEAPEGGVEEASEGPL